MYTRNEGVPAQIHSGVVTYLLRWWALLTALSLMLMIPAVAAETEAEFADSALLVSTERLQSLLTERWRTASYQRESCEPSF